jgi:hypothetical protein
MVIVNDKMQRDYRYTLVAPTGRDFDPAFNPTSPIRGLSAT